MTERSQGLSSEIIQMIVASVPDSGEKKLTELEGERLLNAIARAQSGVPTGTLNPDQSGKQ